MHTGIGADVCAVFNHYVARERRGISHDHAVADQAIVSNVGLGHDQAVVADFGEHATAGSTAVNGDEFTYLVSLADACFGGLTFVLEILGSKSDGDERK